MEQEDDDEDDADAENEEDEGDLTQQTVTANDDCDESDESDGEDEEDDDFQSDYEAEVPEEILHITESNETPVVGDDAEGGKSMADPHLVKGRDGRQYPVTQLVLKFYGNKHSNRQHSRLQRFFENEPYQIMTNNPRGFGAAASLLDACSLSRNDFVVFASECGKKRRRIQSLLGKSCGLLTTMMSKEKDEAKEKLARIRWRTMSCSSVIAFKGMLKFSLPRFVSGWCQ